jgi:hypothetical protein
METAFIRPALTGHGFAGPQNGSGSLALGMRISGGP